MHSYVEKKWSFAHPGQAIAAGHGHANPRKDIIFNIAHTAFQLIRITEKAPGKSPPSPHAFDPYKSFAIANEVKRIE